MSYSGICRCRNPCDSATTVAVTIAESGRNRLAGFFLLAAWETAAKRGEQVRRPKRGLSQFSCQRKWDLSPSNPVKCPHCHKSQDRPF